MLFIRKAFLSFLLLAALAVIAYSQDAEPTPTPRHPLQDELDDAEMRSKIAAARKAEFEARFPKPNADALATSNSVSGDLIESRMQAYKAMDMISANLAAKLKTTTLQVKQGTLTVPTKIKKLYIYREEDFAKIAAYRRLLQQFRIINAEYGACIPGSVSLSPALIAAMAIDWMSLLKTNTTISGAPFDIEDEAVWASLAAKLAQGTDQIVLTNPFVSEFDFLDLEALESSLLLNEVKTAEAYLQAPKCTAATDLPKAVIDAGYKRIKKDLGLALPEPTPTPASTPAKSADPPKPEEKPEPAGGQDLWEYLRVERIMNKMDEEKAFWIKLKNAKSGGNVRTRSTPLIDTFRGGASIKFSGGSIAYYYIFDNTGTVYLAGTEMAYEPYKKSSRIP